MAVSSRLCHLLQIDATGALQWKTKFCLRQWTVAVSEQVPLGRPRCQFYFDFLWICGHCLSDQAFTPDITVIFDDYHSPIRCIEIKYAFPKLYPIFRQLSKSNRNPIGNINCPRVNYKYMARVCVCVCVWLGEWGLEE